MDRDWLTFWSHEYNLRRHLQDANNLDGSKREWHALCDPQAYVQCLRKIAAARNKASTHYEVVEPVARTKARDPQAPWIRDETVALYRANRSHNVLLQALQRFTAEQKRVRQDGVTSNADQTSRNWTKDLEAETRRRSDEIRRLWALRQAWFQAMQVQAQGEDQQSGQDEDPAQEQLAQDWCSAQDHVRAQSRPNTRSQAGLMQQALLMSEQQPKMRTKRIRSPSVEVVRFQDRDRSVAAGKSEAANRTTRAPAAIIARRGDNHKRDLAG
jgi:hypothetical protein